jgi:hypothetical protein
MRPNRRSGKRLLAAVIPAITRMLHLEERCGDILNQGGGDLRDGELLSCGEQMLVMVTVVKNLLWRFRLLKDF